MRPSPKHTHTPKKSAKKKQKKKSTERGGERFVHTVSISYFTSSIPLECLSVCTLIEGPFVSVNNPCSKIKDLHQGWEKRGKNKKSSSQLKKKIIIIIFAPPQDVRTFFFRECEMKDTKTVYQ